MRIQYLVAPVLTVSLVSAPSNALAAGQVIIVGSQPQSGQLQTYQAPTPPQRPQNYRPQTPPQTPPRQQYTPPPQQPQYYAQPQNTQPQYAQPQYYAPPAQPNYSQPAYNRPPAAPNYAPPAYDPQAYSGQAYHRGGTPLFQPAPAAPPPGSYVTQEQFKQLLKIFKRVVDRFDALEKKVAKQGGKSGSSSSDAVDLSALDSETKSGPAAGGQHAAQGTQAGAPIFKVYFDLNLVNRPGIGANALTFSNFHGLLLFEMVPTPDLTFSFDLGLGSNPRFYELDYQVNKRLQVRIGKIWIPFDDMSPHNIFGGRVNVTKLAPENSNTGRFLPDIWAEHGVGLKYNLMDTKSLYSDFHFYIVNGFKQGGTDPKPDSTNPYPDFGDTTLSAEDNNRDKGFGARINAKINGGMLGGGLSYYTAQWTTDLINNETSGRVNILGIDSQLRVGTNELRVGYATMAVGFPNGESFSRAGMYAEASRKLGAMQNWKVLLRGGTISLDNRVLDTSDQTIVGATILYKPNIIEYSLSHSRDLKDSVVKNNHSYTIARVIIAL